MAVPTFAEQVWEVVRVVPFGRVTTYGTIARLLGRPRSARMVGWAMHRCPDDVPAHRVVNRDGVLSGRFAFGHPDLQRSLLEDEDVLFETDDRCILDAHFWPLDGEGPDLSPDDE
ncbi:MAG: MGMT family protein [Chloroflexi bacterium]|nr:MGMT family protein [Chloroflexota bacterium]